MNRDDRAHARETAERIAVDWGLTLVDELPGASCSYVVEVVGNQVLKVPFPEAEECQSWPTVQAFSQHGGVPLLRYDPESGALLMAKLSPGSTLEAADLDDLSKVDICADLILELRKAPLIRGIPLDSWYADLETRAQEPLVVEARRVLSELRSFSGKVALLHGDLHHLNILWDGAAWRVIDPKGLVGDPSFEVVAYMRNPLGKTPDAAGMRARLRRFSERLGDPIDRLWGWSFVETVASRSPTSKFDFEPALASIWEARDLCRG